MKIIILSHTFDCFSAVFCCIFSYISFEVNNLPLLQNPFKMKLEFGLWQNTELKTYFNVLVYELIRKSICSIVENVPLRLKKMNALKKTITYGKSSQNNTYACISMCTTA